MEALEHNALVAVMIRVREWVDEAVCWPTDLPQLVDPAVDDVLPSAPQNMPALDVIAERASAERDLALDHNDALDRKLTTMITAGGAYFGLIAGSLIISDQFAGTIEVAIAALVVVALGTVVALYGLTPRAFRGTDVDWLLEHATFDEPEIVKLLIAHQDRYVASLGRRILVLKGCALRRSGWLLVASLVLTLIAILTGGV